MHRIVGCERGHRHDPFPWRVGINLDADRTADPEVDAEADVDANADAEADVEADLKADREQRCDTGQHRAGAKYSRSHHCG